MSGKLILLIDDEADIIFTVKEILRIKGYLVEAFKSFDEAAEFIHEKKPDLIISDLNALGTLNGIQFYVRHVLDKKLKFALHTGSLYVSNNEVQLKREIPDDYTVVAAGSNQEYDDQIDLIVKSDQKEGRFPCFFKPAAPDMILEYFEM